VFNRAIKQLRKSQNNCVGGIISKYQRRLLLGHDYSLHTSRGLSLAHYNSRQNIHTVHFVLRTFYFNRISINININNSRLKERILCVCVCVCVCVCAHARARVCVIFII